MKAVENRPPGGQYSPHKTAQFFFPNSFGIAAGNQTAPLQLFSEASPQKPDFNAALDEQFFLKQRFSPGTVLGLVPWFCQQKGLQGGGIFGAVYGRR
ncbi:MAG: hypothetical protein CM15mP55_0950 [Hyphomicrobiales bacterium]|nr:MAG: hypothetical protein CM15mP55_0950 [Hyphomicrobiales bacterium]